MKKLLLPALLAMVSLSACAQQNALDRFYNKMKSSDAVSGELSISPSLWFMANFSEKENDVWKNKVSMVRLLILDGQKTPGLASAVDELSQDLQKEDFDALVDVRQGKERLQLLEKDESGNVKSLVLLMRGKDDGTVFAELKGKFTPEDMACITRSLKESQ